MKANQHIVFLCSRLDIPGGIERATVNTANLLASHGYRVTLLVLDSYPNIFYPLVSTVAVEQATLHFGITESGNAVLRKQNFLTHILQLKKILKRLQPDTLLCTEYPFAVAAFFAADKKRVKVMAWEHHHFYGLKRNRFWQALYTFVYPRLQKVVCLNAAEAQLFAASGCRTVVLPNYISPSTKAALNKPNLLTIGWLTKSKGVDLIPAIAELVFQQFPHWHWTLIGTGPEEASLLAAIAAKGFETNLSVVHPSSPNMQAYYEKTSVYVMTSRFECLPMVLLEAMSHGIPCVAFDCPTGPAFVIQPKKNGLLVEENNTHAMAAAIVQLIQNAEERNTLGANAYESIARFSPDSVFALWQALLAE